LYARRVEYREHQGWLLRVLANFFARSSSDVVVLRETHNIPKREGIGDNIDADQTKDVHTVTGSSGQLIIPGTVKRGGLRPVTAWYRLVLGLHVVVVELVLVKSLVTVLVNRQVSNRVGPVRKSVS